MIITIDGPTASGKSSAGRNLAKKLGYYYLYSGLLFRALAYVLINKFGYTMKDLEHPRMQDINAVLDAQRFVYRYDDQFKERVFFDNTDITPFLKDSLIDSASSIMSMDKTVRDILLLYQRKIAQEFPIVVDGRDAGSVVFPEADIKFFLTASEEERAQRWQRQQVRRGNDISLEQAKTFIKERDQRDANRAIAPMIIPDDAIVIDNSQYSSDQTLEKMVHYIQANT